MKPFIYILIGIAALMLSCSNDDILYNNTTENISDYSLAGSSCTWKNVEKGVLYIIKSTDDLKKYIVSPENDFPVIDFEKNILLLVQGVNLSGIHSIEKQLKQFDENKFKLKIIISSNATTVVESWTVAVLVPKLPDKTEFMLTVEKN